MAVLLDDLHQADADTLALLETVASGLAGAGSSLLLMAAYRPAEAGGLEQALAVLARRSPARLPLEGLPAPDALGARTAGNPFYLKESAKLLASEGARWRCPTSRKACGTCSGGACPGCPRPP